MRAMPSPTSRTRPTSSTPTSLPYWSISFRRTETISSGLNLMAAALDQLIADDVQLMADAGIVEPVAHLHDHTPEQVGIDLLFQHRLAFGDLAKLVDEPAALVVQQGRRCPHLDAHLVGPLFQQDAVD